MPAPNDRAQGVSRIEVSLESRLLALLERLLGPRGLTLAEQEQVYQKLKTAVEHAEAAAH